jgi:3-hydroxyacyl-[acyl-carrier-protein] dehydratase
MKDESDRGGFIHPSAFILHPFLPVPCSLFPVPCLGLWTLPMLGRHEIERLIPHRPPFLWLDEVIERTDSSIRARKFIDPKLDVFAGHYPRFPVLPGVLQCEAAFQAGAVLIAKLVPPGEDRVPVVTRLNNVKFRRMVRPGDMLDIYAELTEQLSSAYFLQARTSVDGQTTCSLEFACTLAPTGD